MTELMSGHASANVEPESLFIVRARFDDPHVVEMSGELDLGSRTAAIDACTSIDHLDVLVDLSGLAFMDCAGYDALDTAKSILERRGGSLVVMNAVGEPLRLLALIDLLEVVPCGPLRARHPGGITRHDVPAWQDTTTADRLADAEPASAGPIPPGPYGCGASLVDR